MEVSGPHMVDTIAIDTDEESFGGEENQFSEEWIKPRRENPKFTTVLDAKDWKYKLNFPVSFVREHLDDMTLPAESDIIVGQFDPRLAQLVDFVPRLNKRGKKVKNCVRDFHLSKGGKVEIQLTNRDDMNNRLFFYIRRHNKAMEYRKAFSPEL